ncbi:MAG TPA: 3'-5' exonuclease [Candidatus Absconditabacterales bacterium]|nr:3'-5' exonuclease [Candidatus Absconditabacterales bacterium]
MLLNNKYRYIGLDFETTGLDVSKDEPIQIGIIELDSTGKIINEYQSLIKPNKKTDELKHIVGFITGLSIGELENAPTREEILPQIEKFFGENTIIIGHNIGFDIDFLTKYFPTLNYYKQIDTFNLAQTIVHYAPSYALEVLIENLKSEKLFTTIFSEERHGEEKSHDAFFDTKNSNKLFLYFVKNIYELINTYPNLVHIINQTEGIWKEILELATYEDTPQIKINFPALGRIMANNTSMAKTSTGIDTDSLENQKKYYIGNISIKDLLTALAENKNIILAFQNIQKLDIAKAILNDMGIKNIGFTKEDQTINQEAFQRFLNKGIFSQEECFFIIKYLSHLKKGLGILNLNNQSDYKIYYYIKDTRNQKKYPIILTTHHGLFTSMQDNEDMYKDYDICFFDTEQWYKSYNFFLSSPCDLYYTLNILESFIYQKDVDNQIQGIKKEAEPDELQQFINIFQVYIGVLFNESTKLFIKTEATMVQHDPIRDHGDFYQSNLLRKQLIEKKESVKKILSEENYAIVEKHIAHIQKVFDSVINIFKKMYGNGEFYFTYGEAQKFTDRKEFVDIFKNKVIFFTNTNKQSPAITSNGTPHLSSGATEGGKIQNIKVVPPVIDRLVTYIIDEVQKEPDNISYFIFSPKKDESKKIFEDLCKNNINKQAVLLVENITGGMGKNIFKAKQTKNKIIIGGYNFILFLYANKVSLKEIIMFNARGPSEQNILDDIKWYNITN